MNTTIKFMSLILGISIALVACDKEESKGKDCYTCNNCEGQFGHLMNQEYCVDGFDNRKDWLDMKAVYENDENNCDCEFN